MTRVNGTNVCLDTNQLMALLHEERPPALLLALEPHLAACAECRKLVSALLQADSGVRFAERKAISEASLVRGADLALAPTVPGSELHPDLGPGSLVGRYVVEKRLGAGAMGIVFVAHDPELDRKVAVKILNHARFAPGEGKLIPDRLRREAQAMAQLAHPNVVTVHDVGTVWPAGCSTAATATAP